MKIAIIGGGAAGCFAAIQIKDRQPDAEVHVWEAGRKALAKVAVTGGGRCNVTNSFREVDSIERVYPRGSRLMKRLLRAFSHEDTYRWFETNGVRLVTQDDQCVFPQSQDALEIVDTLLSLMRSKGVRLHTGCRVASLTQGEEGFTLHFAQNLRAPEHADRVLVTTLTKKMAQDLTDFFVEAGIRARYLHSDIKTLERHELIRGLRTGEFDVLVGINLLREGLDLPEVSMVAILDADKEGFLRNYRSLIQTMGRASRNVNGTVLLFADNMTDSLEKAVTETARRRAVQEEFNKEHGITPKSVTRKLEDDLRINDPLGDIGDDSVDADWEDPSTSSGTLGGIRPMEPLQPSSKTKKKGTRGSTQKRHPEAEGDEIPSPLRGSKTGDKLEDLERQMKEAAAKLDFEEAARLRDIIRGMKG